MLYPPTGILLMLSGLYMTTIVWGWQAAWPRVSLVAMVLLAIIGGAVTGPRLGALARAAADEQGPLSSGLRARLQAPRLLVSVQFRAAIALGNVCLMTLKPSLGGALFTLGVALTAGLAAAAQAIRHTDSHGVPEHQG